MIRSIAKLAFIALLLVHGLVHLLGFLKACDLGFLWLITALLFIITAVAFAFKNHWWWATAILAAIFSQFLSKSFITYMGVGDSDLRIDIQQTDHIADKAAEIAAAMGNDKSIAGFVVLTTKTSRVKLADGSEESIKVELGDHAVFPLTYVQGRAPAAENEIALSVLNASEMGKR